jgi:pyruvate dehydrogenase E2 component (dihydrolipoamide acetyltransferase)
MAELLMPRLTDSMDEGTIVRWLVDDGAAVEAGQEVVEIETDKATMPYESDAAGVLRIAVREGETVPVGAPIATVGEASSPAPSLRPRLSVSPIAARVAARAGVDIAAVAGSGPQGRVFKRDVVAFLEAAPAQPPAPAPPPAELRAPPPSPSGARGEVETQQLTRGQAVVARQMAQSKATAPDFWVAADIDMSDALELRARLKEAFAPAPSVNDLILKASALALREHPGINASFADDAVQRHGCVNVGVAVAADHELVVPIVHDADRMSLGAIAQEVRRLAERVRDASVSPADLDGATFTVSNLGMFGVDRFAGIINPPQAAILCVGAVQQRPVVRDGEVVARASMTMTLVCDHRLVYGADAAQFLADVRANLESPLRLVR